MENTNKMRIVYGDLNLGMHGEDFSYIFSYATGGMESLVIKGHEWLYRAPKPTFWRALTCNDRGSKFMLKSGMWLASDVFIKCKEIKVAVEGQAIPLPIAPENNKYSANEYAENMTITFTYETITVPATTVDVSYDVWADGKIEVSVHYHGCEGLPQLPVFGMRFIAPTKAKQFTYKGLSGETYPDRKWGGVHGVHTVEGLPVAKYMVPQECGMHVETEWVEIYRDTRQDNRKKYIGAEGTTLRISMVDEPFAFSCLPYTAEELENATHHEELPPARRTVIGVYGAVRGVGGIDSWGADVEEAYHIDATKDICYKFRIN